MKPDAERKFRQLRGNLEGMRENTEGGDPEIVTLLHKLDKHTFVWVGKSPLPKKRLRVGGIRR